MMDNLTPEYKVGFSKAWSELSPIMDNLRKEIEDYKTLLRLVYKQPISQEMVTKVLKKWEEK